MNKLWSKYTLIAFIAAVLIPDIALASVSAAGDGINSALLGILGLMTGKIAKTIITLAIAGTGYLAFTGHIPWKVMINIAVGAGIVIGSKGIADVLAGFG